MRSLCDCSKNASYAFDEAEVLELNLFSVQAWQYTFFWWQQVALPKGTPGALSRLSLSALQALTKRLTFLTWCSIRSLPWWFQLCLAVCVVVTLLSFALTHFSDPGRLEPQALEGMSRGLLCPGCHLVLTEAETTYMSRSSHKQAGELGPG